MILIFHKEDFNKKYIDFIENLFFQGYKSENNYLLSSNFFATQMTMYLELEINPNFRPPHFMPEQMINRNEYQIFKIT